MREDVRGRLEFRLTYADVDMVQFFFADYYRWMDRALAELMEECGYPRRASLERRRGFPVVESGCTYVGRALVDEKLTVEARFVHMSNRAFRVGYDFAKLDGAEVAHGFTQHVCVDLDAMRPVAVPEQFRGEDADE